MRRKQSSSKCTPRRSCAALLLCSQAAIAAGLPQAQQQRGCAGLLRRGAARARRCCQASRGGARAFGAPGVPAASCVHRAVSYSHPARCETQPRRLPHQRCRRAGQCFAVRRRHVHHRCVECCSDDVCAGRLLQTNAHLACFMLSHNAGDVFVAGDVTLEGSPCVTGDVIVLGSAHVCGDVCVTGNVHA